MTAANPAFPAAAGGALDTAFFLIRRPSLFRRAPGRAAGSVAFLALWTTLATRTAFEGDGTADRYTQGLAAALFAGNLAMLGVHLRHGIAGPRVFLGTLLSGVALADCVRRG